MLQEKPQGSLLLCVANILVTAAVVAVTWSLWNEVEIGRSLILLAFAVGLFLPGAFNAYLLDTYKRKNIAMMALVVLGLVHFFIHISSSSSLWVILSLCFLQGVSFALVQVSLGSTLLNDLSSSERRDVVDQYFALSGKEGWVLGLIIMACCEIFPTDYGIGVWFPIVGVLMALLLVASLKVPFRAPLVLPLCSIDRFWFRGESVLWISTFFMAGAMGFLLGNLCTYSCPVLFLVMALCSFPMFFVRVANSRRWVAWGFLLLVILLLSEHLLPSDQFAFKIMVYACSGFSMSLLAVGYLSSFLERADHCQRGTAQHSYMLACESGVVGGLALMGIVPKGFYSFTEFLIVMSAILLFLIIKRKKAGSN